MSGFAIFITSILISCAIMIVSGVNSDSNQNKITKNDIVFFISAAYCIIGMLFSVYGICHINNINWKESDIVNSTSIVALNDNSLASGRSCFLGRGYIDEKIYYFYLKKINDGGFKQDKIETEYTILYYDNSNYRIDEYKLYKDWLFFHKEQPLYKVYMPENSITNEFIVDLE